MEILYEHTHTHTYTKDRYIIINHKKIYLKKNTRKENIDFQLGHEKF